MTPPGPGARASLLAGLTLGLALGTALGFTLAMAWLVVDERQTSRRQAAWLAGLAGEQRFSLENRPSPAMHFPGDGPFDRRLGYHGLPQAVRRLQDQGFAVTAQARQSPAMLERARQGLNPAYREKVQAGLQLLDCRAEPLFTTRVPELVWDRFDRVPPLLVASLLFIENQELLQPPAMRNPAVEWDRLAKALLDQGLRHIDADHSAGGGSTLATQIEKYRHSPQGRTTSAAEKLRQVASASLRAYLDGPDTRARRQQIVLDYLNTVPLSAQAGFGEVLGLGDGLWAWYGRELAELNRLLNPHPEAGSAASPAAGAATLADQAMAFKQALSLMVAQRRPSHYLGAQGAQALRELTDSHLRLLAQAGVLEPRLRDAALPLALQPLPRAPSRPALPFNERKAASALRTQLQGLLGLPRAYDLDRLDLAAHSPLAGGLQQTVTTLLGAVRQPGAARAAGLYGEHLFRDGDDPSTVAWSFTLYERAGGANVLRVQTDNVDQPFDLNAGARLDMGSTAKLRTLLTYLEQVAALHARWQALDAATLRALPIAPHDAIAAWARQHLAQAADRSLPAMLAAALERSYAAHPGETFFTGGGVHRFENFDADDNTRRLSVREAFARSVNLVFIRLMRDVVQRVLADLPQADAALLADPADPRRRAWLERFADLEGRQYIARFHRQYAQRTPQQAEEALLLKLQPTPVRLASVFFALEPGADELQLLEFLARRLPGAQGSLQALHDTFRGGLWSLADRAYLAGLHPLELWVAGHLRRHPQATLTQTLAASADERQQVYRWLFSPRRKAAQDQRIRALLEVEAFLEIHRTWQRLGYPFESLTPSYATALGASGDRPAALAELMGIVVNRGRRLPLQRFASLRFATATPYETHLAPVPAAGEQVLHPAVADAARQALIAVVEGGTARRLHAALRQRNGQPFVMAGKTGTGDHRFDTFGRGGQLVSSRVVSRSASLVFMIGDRWFGTLMAYAQEPHAARLRFTSALPAQLLKALAAELAPALEDGLCGGAKAAAPS